MTNFNSKSLLNEIVSNKNVYPLLSISNIITEKESKYTVFNFYEGYVDQNKKFVKSISGTDKILLHGNLVFESDNCKPFDYFRYEYVHSVTKDKIKLNDAVSTQYNFVCLNACPKLHRMFTISELYRRKLNGKISFLNRSSGCYHNDLKQLYKWQTDKDACDYVSDLYSNNKQLLVDLDVTKSNDREQSSDLYKDCLVSLITESYGHTNDVGYKQGYTDIELGYKILFVTEKSYKAFANLQIPIWIALPGTVNYFRQQGFDVFDDVIDHSYDNQTDHVLRYIGAVDQLEQFIKQKPTINNMEQRLRNNKKLLFDSEIDRHTIRLML